MNLEETLREAAATLRSHRVEVPELTARVLLAHALERDQSWLAAHSDEPITEDRRQGYAEMIRTRCEGLPTQYICGYQEFFELAIHVTPDVLIPRPETEHLVEAAIARVRPGDRVADIGTGSGAIAIAVARSSPGSVISASDLSCRALRVAAANATRLESSVQFCQGDLAGPFRQGSFDVVVSNPPYVPRKDMGGLQRELRHEPSIALFGGEDGLRIVGRLVHDAPRILKPGGWFLAEIGFNSRPAIEAMLRRPEWAQPEFLKDLAGIDRVVAVRRSSSSLHRDA
ncbi:MAG: peptide chain release factor N(5)-glutamine methyltransferase [Bryobacterales bacterium]|nr:peptide chain release factor N(5)-glutamine methyltransferase [Bryobacterales bacterium]